MYPVRRNHPVEIRTIQHPVVDVLSMFSADRMKLGCSAVQAVAFVWLQTCIYESILMGIAQRVHNNLNELFHALSSFIT